MPPTDYLSSLFGLSGKVAVVVGGTGELCSTMADGLARAGAEVVLADLDNGRADARLQKIREAGGNAWFFPVDATRKADIEALLAAVVKKSGGVDILINGAGINSSTPFLDISEDEFDRIFRVNVKALVLACQVFGRHMVERGKGGSIINLGSASGNIPLSRVFTYSATKAAVQNLTKNLAREWAPHRVRVNAMVPGFFPAEQNKKVLTPDRIEAIMGHTPMKRFGEPRELVGATLLLSSDGAGSFITGTEMVVDGGFLAMTI